MLCNFIFTVKTLHVWSEVIIMSSMYLLTSPMVIIRSFKDEMHANVLIREMPVQAGVYLGNVCNLSIDV